MYFSIFTTLLIVIASCISVQAANHHHVMYNMKNPKRISEGSCSRTSPETFFYHTAQPSLSLLYLRSKVFFGVLMDQMESSFLSSTESERENKTREEWEFITKTVSESLDSAVDRTETSWRYFIITHETQPLPWEMQFKFALLHEALYQLEYSYSMIDAVVRSGTKEIVGTLQHQLTSVIRKLEGEVSRISKSGDEVTEPKLFRQMKQALAGMKSSFTTKLLEKVVSRAQDRYHSDKVDSSNANQETFVSETIDQIAIVFHAFRERSAVYPNFWHEMYKIFENEFQIRADMDEDEMVVKFMRNISDQNNLINLIVQLISRENKSNS